MTRYGELELMMEGGERGWGGGGERERAMGREKMNCSDYLICLHCPPFAVFWILRLMCYLYLLEA